jgi:hypothetical protein
MEGRFQMADGMVKPDARSPYQRYGKAPTLYSAEYQRWAAATRKNDDAARNAADRDWRRRFGMYPKKAEPV